MLRSALVVGLMATGFVAAGAAAPDGPARVGFGHWPGGNSPLRRLVSGSVGRLLVLRSELNVSDEQRAELRRVVGSHREEIAGTVKSVRAKRLALRDAVLSGADEAAIRAAANGLGEAIADASVKAGKLRNELAPVLTDEQRQRIKKFFADNDESISNLLEQVSHSQ